MFESVNGQTDGRLFNGYTISLPCEKSNRKAMNRNWGNQKANSALKTKAGNK